mmetsp:Transcript_50876/g.150000  ORF Transcript_50876/g.150000 Transcript_50876/m.150000 type:complete len:334 (+) Transcript_50876:1443-2444(+)
MRATHALRGAAFASEIASHDFPRSHLEIDDRWSAAYGDFVFDELKFPDAAGMVRRLHQLGFTVTLWVVPFAEPSADAFADGAALGAWLREEDGTPALVQWWQGRGALLNVSDAHALAWFERRLRALMDATGVDGFKFDAGEASFAPSHLVPRPNDFAGEWARFASRFGGGGEVRAAHRSQDAALWVREFDKESVWGAANGLASLVTTALQLGVLGYPWVLPDMVGGNAYNADVGQPAALAQPASDGAAGAADGERSHDAGGSDAGGGAGGGAPAERDDYTEEELRGMGVKQLKGLLKAKGLPECDAIEKADLVAAVVAAQQLAKEAAAPAPAQ